MNSHRRISSQCYAVVAASAMVALTALHAQNTAGAHVASGDTRIVAVSIREFKYDPETVTVHAGDIVEWRNEDSVPHTVTGEVRSDGYHFDSKAIAKGGAWRYIAKRKGTYSYTCTFHPNMEGTLIVQ